MTDMPYRTDLSGAILKLQENGMMNELQFKWWKQKRGGNVCEVRERLHYLVAHFLLPLFRGSDYMDYVCVARL